MLHLSFQMLPSYAYNIAFPFPFLFPFYLPRGQICASNTVVPVCLIQQLLRKDIRSRVRLNALGFMGYYFYYHILHVCMYVCMYVCIYIYIYIYIYIQINTHTCSLFVRQIFIMQSTIAPNLKQVPRIDNKQFSYLN